VALADDGGGAGAQERAQVVAGQRLGILEPDAALVDVHVEFGEAEPVPALAVAVRHRAVGCAEVRDGAVAVAGQVLHHLEGGAGVVRRDRRDGGRRLDAADGDEREALGREALDLVGGDVAAEEDGAVGHQQLVDAVAVHRAAAPLAARAGEEQQVVVLRLGLVLDADQEREVEAARLQREDGLVREHTQDAVLAGGEAARHRVGGVAELAHRFADARHRLLADPDLVVDLVVEHERDDRGRDACASGDVHLPGAAFGHDTLLPGPGTNAL
jgi:hypothetical protein